MTRLRSPHAAARRQERALRRGFIRSCPRTGETPRLPRANLGNLAASRGGYDPVFLCDPWAAALRSRDAVATPDVRGPPAASTTTRSATTAAPRGEEKTTATTSETAPLRAAPDLADIVAAILPMLKPCITEPLKPLLDYFAKLADLFAKLSARVDELEAFLANKMGLNDTPRVDLRPVPGDPLPPCPPPRAATEPDALADPRLPCTLPRAALDDDLCLGAPVLLGGLKSVSFNGMTGTVASELDDAGRIGILLPSSRALKSIKKENLFIMKPSSSTTPSTPTGAAPGGDVKPPRPTHTSRSSRPARSRAASSGDDSSNGEPPWRTRASDTSRPSRSEWEAMCAAIDWQE